MKNICCIVPQKCHFIERDELFLPSFKKEKQLVYCDNIPGLLGELGIPSYNPEEWRLFFGQLQAQPQVCDLTHNGNRYEAVPVGHSTVLKEQQNDITVINKSLRPPPKN